MTELLKRVLDVASMLPKELQDQLAVRPLRELADEANWDTSFADSAAALEKLADQALREHDEGRLPQDLPLLHAVEWALTEAHGSAPYRVGIGGTLPISDIARRELHIDTVTLSFSIADEDFHAPNEFFRLSSIDTGLRAWTALWRRLDETGI